MTRKRMLPGDREDWLLDRIPKEIGGRVDICNAAFVDAYIEATGAAYKPVNYGAHKCAQLGRDLSRMAEKRLLRRARIGIEGMAGMGFPSWVWSYRI